jgi:hypothetical protein
MRRILQVVGAIALVVVALVAAGLGYAAYRGGSLDAESKAYVDAAVPAIAAHWDREQLIARAAPELLKATNPAQLQVVFDTFAKAGPLVQYDGAKGQSSMSYFTGTGSSITAVYIATAHCRDAIVTINLNLIKRDGKWMILGFHVDTSFAKNAAHDA